MRTRYLFGALLWCFFSASTWAEEATVSSREKESCLEVNKLWRVEDQPTARDAWLLEITNANRCRGTGEMSDAMDAAMRALSIAKSTKDFLADELDTSAKVVARLLQEQGHFSQLSQFAEQMAKEESNKLSKSDVKAWKVKAIFSARQAKEPDTVTRLQQALFSDAKPYGKLWVLDVAHNQLRYDLASLKFPLVSGGWMLAGFTPAGARGEAAEIIYVTGKTPEEQIALTFKVSYDEPDVMTLLDEKVKVSPEQAHIDRWQKRLPLRQELPTPKGELPNLSFAQAKSAKFMEAKDAHGLGTKTRLTDAKWVSARGDWIVEAQTSFNQQRHKEAARAITILFSTVKWPKAPKLYQSKMMSSHLFGVETELNDYRNYLQVMTLADLALKDAVFPGELSELNAAMGMAQYHLNNRQEAKTLLDRAMALEEYGGSYPYGLYRQSIQYMADIAWHEGRTAEGEKLNQRVLLSRPLAHVWAMGDNSRAVVSQKYGIVLPIRLGDFYLEAAQKGYPNGAWFDYHNVDTRRRITLYILNVADFPVGKREQRFSYAFAGELGRRLDNAVSSTMTYADASVVKDGVMWRFNAFPEFDKTDEVVLSTAVLGDKLMVLHTRVHKDRPEELQEVEAFVRKFVWEEKSSGQQENGR